MFKFPFTNYQEINLDWIIKKVRELIDKVEHDSSVVTDYEARLIATENAAAAAVETADTAATTAAAAQSTAGNALDRSIDTENNLSDFENNTIGPLSGLTTTDKSSIVAAINEAARSGGGGGGGGAVDSVNGQTGDVVLDASDVGALPDSYTAPVESVNGKTGVVELDASDVGALPDSYTAPVSSVNHMTGAVRTVIKQTYNFSGFSYDATSKGWYRLLSISLANMTGVYAILDRFLIIPHLSKELYDAIKSVYPDCNGIEAVGYLVSSSQLSFYLYLYTENSTNNPASTDLRQKTVDIFVITSY